MIVSTAREGLVGSDMALPRILFIAQPGRIAAADRCGL
jgi:hypothetical protein